ncbi:MAG: arginase [Saprospiraceae bacterium]
MQIKIIKNRSDIGAGTRGSDMGIDAIEIAGINKDNNYFDRFPFQDVDTHNESIYNKVRNSWAKRMSLVVEQCKRVSETVRSTMKDGFFPIVISGDHSSALGTISGIKAAYPEKRLGVLWIDAHADLHSPYTSPSGNVHGMPLAAALGVDNKHSKDNKVSEETIINWASLKNIGVTGAKVNPEDIIYFGVRETEEPEKTLMSTMNIKNYMVEELRHRGADICINEAIQSLEVCDMIYISFDVDSLDCDSISKGTGTPVPRGFDEYEVMNIIQGFLKTKKVCCFEIVEVNPLLDLQGNKMAETAFEVLDDFTNHLLNF